MTYIQESKSNRLYVTLRDFGIDENTQYGLKDKKYDYNAIMPLLMFTPTNQSHLGEKFNCYSKLNNKSLDKFLKAIFSGLGVNSVYLYDSFSEKTKNKKDLKKVVLSDKDTMICLRCGNGTRDSLFMAIRNALAHGNIVEKDGFIVLYSISNDQKEYDSTVSFLLRIKNISKLNAFSKTLKAYI